MRKYLHIVLLLSLACLISGCVAESVPTLEGTGIQLWKRSSRKFPSVSMA